MPSEPSDIEATVDWLFEDWHTRVELWGTVHDDNDPNTADVKKQAVAQIQTLISQRVIEALEGVRDDFNLDTEDIDELNRRIAELKGKQDE